LCSGSGGAIFAQTTAVNLTKCTFESNVALTGQFDSGSAGGAIMLEDCYPAYLGYSTFSHNGAAGYYGESCVCLRASLRHRYPSCYI
jgi:hypothetical protein